MELNDRDKDEIIRSLREKNTKKPRAPKVGEKENVRNHGNRGNMSMQSMDDEEDDDESEIEDMNNDSMMQKASSSAINVAQNPIDISWVSKADLSFSSMNPVGGGSQSNDESSQMLDTSATNALSGLNINTSMDDIMNTSTFIAPTMPIANMPPSNPTITKAPPKRRKKLNTDDITPTLKNTRNKNITKKAEDLTDVLGIQYASDINNLADSSMTGMTESKSQAAKRKKQAATKAKNGSNTTNSLMFPDSSGLTPGLGHVHISHNNLLNAGVGAGGNGVNKTPMTKQQRGMSMNLLDTPYTPGSFLMMDSTNDITMTPFMTGLFDSLGHGDGTSPGIIDFSPNLFTPSNYHNLPPSGSKLRRKEQINSAKKTNDNNKITSSSAAAMTVNNLMPAPTTTGLMNSSSSHLLKNSLNGLFSSTSNMNDENVKNNHLNVMVNQQMLQQQHQQMIQSQQLMKMKPTSSSVMNNSTSLLHPNTEVEEDSLTCNVNDISGISIEGNIHDFTAQSPDSMMVPDISLIANSSTNVSPAGFMSPGQSLSDNMNFTPYLTRIFANGFDSAESNRILDSEDRDTIHHEISSSSNGVLNTSLKRKLRDDVDDEDDVEGHDDVETPSHSQPTTTNSFDQQSTSFDRSLMLNQVGRSSSHMETPARNNRSSIR